MFTDAWVVANADRSMIFDRPLQYIRSSAVDLIRTVLRQPAMLLKYGQLPDAKRDLVGTPAVLNQEGFRYDGSYRFSLVRLAQSRKTNLTANFLVQAMPGSPSISQKQMASLQRLSDIARERGISLVGIQLPYIKEGIEYLDTNESYHSYSGVWREFESAETRDRFAKMGIKFFDLARTVAGDDKSNFIDAFHPSEIGMLEVMRELLKHPDFRGEFPKINPGLLTVTQGD
jgi:hypothetical protein